MKLTIRLLLLSLFSQSFAATQQLEMDGMSLSRDLKDSLSIDRSIRDGTTVAVARLQTRGGDNIGPYGMTSYVNAELQIVTRLFGGCPERIICHYFVSHTEANSNRGDKPFKRFEPPPLNTDLLVMGTINFKGGRDGNEPRFSIQRYIEATPEHIELVGSLIREYKVKELSADPKLTLRLEQELSAALKAPSHPAKKIVSQTQEAPSSDANNGWWLTCSALATLALAIIWWMGHQKRQT